MIYNAEAHGEFLKKQKQNDTKRNKTHILFILRDKRQATLLLSIGYIIYEC